MMKINKLVIPIGLLSLYSIRKFLVKEKSANEENFSSEWLSLIKETQKVLNDIAWYYTKKKAYNYASNLLLGSTNYDYWAVSEAHSNTNDSFLKYVQSQILSDPKQLFPAQVESVGMTKEWKAAMLRKLEEDSNYIPYSTQIEWGLVILDNANLSSQEAVIHSKITGALGDRIQELVRSEPGLVSEYQAREYGLYDEWRANLDAKINADPLYLDKLFNLEE